MSKNEKIKIFPRGFHIFSRNKLNTYPVDIDEATINVVGVLGRRGCWSVLLYKQ